MIFKTIALVRSVLKSRSCISSEIAVLIITLDTQLWSEERDNRNVHNTAATISIASAAVPYHAGCEDTRLQAIPVFESEVRL